MKKKKVKPLVKDAKDMVLFNGETQTALKLLDGMREEMFALSEALAFFHQTVTEYSNAVGKFSSLMSFVSKEPSQPTGLVGSAMREVGLRVHQETQELDAMQQELSSFVQKDVQQLEVMVKDCVKLLRKPDEKKTPEDTSKISQQCEVIVLRVRRLSSKWAMLAYSLSEWIMNAEMSCCRDAHTAIKDKKLLLPSLPSAEEERSVTGKKITEVEIDASYVAPEEAEEVVVKPRSPSKILSFGARRK